MSAMMDVRTIAFIGESPLLFSLLALFKKALLVGVP
jgi:hypothetical protein